MRTGKSWLWWIVAAPALVPAEQPAWLAEARAREAALAEPVAVASDDKAISFRVPFAPQGKLTGGARSWVVTFELAPKVIASCEILKEETDVGALLRQMALITFTDSIEPQQGQVEARGVERVDAAIAGATPYLATSWLYRANDGKAQKLGALQQVAANHGNHGIYCALNDLGYRQTFTTLARTLIETLQARDDAPPPNFREVSLVSLRDMKVGYSFLDLRRAADGNTLIEERSVLLVPAGTDQLRTQDTLQTQTLRPDGKLVNEVQVASNDGQIETNLVLKEAPGGGWIVEGQHQGKDIQSSFAAGTPSSWLSQTALRRELLAKPNPIDSRATHTQWLSADPGRLTEATMRVIGAIDANTFTVRETAAGASLDYVVDRASGQATRATMRVGPAEFRIERVYVQGKP